MIDTNGKSKVAANVTMESGSNTSPILKIGVEESSAEYQCNSCLVDCSSMRYHSRKHDEFHLCMWCFDNGKIDLETSLSEFFLVESTDVLKDMFLNLLFMDNESDIDALEDTFVAELFAECEIMDNAYKIFDEMTKRCADTGFLDSVSDASKDMYLAALFIQDKKTIDAQMALDEMLEVSMNTKSLDCDCNGGVTTFESVKHVYLEAFSTNVSGYKLYPVLIENGIIVPVFNSISKVRYIGWKRCMHSYVIFCIDSICASTINPTHSHVYCGISLQLTKLSVKESVLLGGPILQITLYDGCKEVAIIDLFVHEWSANECKIQKVFQRWGSVMDKNLSTTKAKVLLVYTEPYFSISTVPRIAQHWFCSDKRYLLTMDSTGRVKLWHIIGKIVIQNGIEVSIEEAKLFEIMSTPSWIIADILFKNLASQFSVPQSQFFLGLIKFFYSYDEKFKMLRKSLFPITDEGAKLIEVAEGEKVWS